MKDDAIPAVDLSFGEGRFAGWSAETLAAQCMMQARDSLDPEFMQFMEAVASRLTPAPSIVTGSDERAREGFIEHIHRHTPNGEWITVQHHPNGDWSVVNAPLTLSSADVRTKAIEIAAGFVSADYPDERDIQIAQAGLLAASRPKEAGAGEWRSISTVDRVNGKRLILAWDDCPTLPYHWEVGRWSKTLGWVNTYGKPFEPGEPTHWMEPCAPSAASPATPKPPVDAKGMIEDAMDNAGAFDPGEVVVPVGVALALARDLAGDGAGA